MTAFLIDHVGLAIDALVDPAWCAARIAELERAGFERTGERYPARYRDNDRLVVDDAALAAALYDLAAPHLPRELVIANERWQLAGLNTRFRACRYTGGQAFCIHRDGAHVAADDLRSHLTLQIYLDADPALAGGRTRFYAGASGGTPIAAIAPRTGTAIVFDHRAWHDGEAVTAGTKHVLRTDVMYRRVTRAALAHDPHTIGSHAGYAWRVIARRDGSLASVGRDGCVRTWQAVGATWRGRELALGLGSVTAIAEDASGTLWCGTRSGALVRIAARATELRDAQNADVRVVDRDLGAVLAIAVDDAGVVASTARGELVAVAPDGTPRWTRAGHVGWAWDLTATARGVPSPGGADVSRGNTAGVVSCGDDGRVVHVDPGGATRVIGELGVPCRAIAALPSGELVAGDTSGVLHDLARGTSWRAHDATITSLVALGDGTFASSAEDGCVMRWTGDRGELVARADDFVTSLAASATGLVSAGYDGAIRRL